jgi:hypothetical protein
MIARLSREIETKSMPTLTLPNPYPLRRSLECLDLPRRADVASWDGAGRMGLRNAKPRRGIVLANAVGLLQPGWELRASVVVTWTSYGPPCLRQRQASGSPARRSLERGIICYLENRRSLMFRSSIWMRTNFKLH